MTSPALAWPAAQFIWTDTGTRFEVPFAGDVAPRVAYYLNIALSERLQSLLGHSLLSSEVCLSTDDAQAALIMVIDSPWKTDAVQLRETIDATVATTAASVEEDIAKDEQAKEAWIKKLLGHS